MRLTDPVSTMVATAITAQIAPSETVDYEVLFGLAGRPGGVDPELTIVIVGEDSEGARVMAPPATIHAATTTQAAIDDIVEDALAWIRAR
ncbi:hypothetical protein ACFQ08_12160 [Streptosporangium algeriense]|uniref:Uncharacterized protein n=1 Tax=Streptosporangium algeriense TaxID=1682748 RepID=A0ABW3DN26_9ACTN